jgi:hypothetical protein
MKFHSLTAFLSGGYERRLTIILFAQKLSYFLFAHLFMGHSNVSYVTHKHNAGWYARIVESGYMEGPIPGRSTGHYSEYAFFPAYPMLVRAVGRVTTWDFHLSAFFVSTLASWAAYLCLFRLLRRTLGDTRRAFLSTVAVLVFPFAIHHSMPYTESLFLLCMTACFSNALRESAGAFVFWAVLATLTRANGVFLSLPIALFMLENGRFDPRKYLRLLAFPAALSGYCAWLKYRTGDAFAFSTAMRAWGREFNWPWNTLFSNGADFHQIHSWVAVFALVFLAVMTLRRMRPSFLTLSWGGGSSSIDDGHHRQFRTLHERTFSLRNSLRAILSPLLPYRHSPALFGVLSLA